MKNAIRLALAGSALLGCAVSHAASAPLPSSGTSDLWLFVTDTSKNETFAEDTGISIASLGPATYTSGASLASSPVTIDLPPSAALSSFLTTNAGDNLFWGVQGDVQSATKAAVAGHNIIIQSNPLPAANTGGIGYGSFTNINAGMNQDEAYMAATVTQGGSAVFNLASGTTTGNAWGVGPGNIAGSVDLYGQGANGENTLGASSPEGLYLITGASSTTAITSYVLSTTLELVNGTLETSSSSVPIPAAIWLLGSGLLGLAGVGRRRAASAAAVAA
jgi:hypothetical protein